MNKIDRVFVVTSLLAAIFLMIMINLTTPSDIGPLGVLVFFTLMYLVCLGVIVGLCRLFFIIKGRLGDRARVSRRKSYYYGSVLAFVPMVLIFMRSFGELNILEIALVIIFAVLGCFYISKRT
ncbi:hypothetical protein FWF89_02665 [Candidatus Saccharibacteria bacterium]|nr:hypothetical protein [Candidatus Saccharibacteria bacterium]